MNEATKLDELSYKQLQALAHQYKIPGNMRKHILIKLLEAVKVGNHLEVNEILREQYQNRKKRAQKNNKQLEKILHAEKISNYNRQFNDDILYTENASQAQWMFNADREVDEMTGGMVNRYGNRAQIPDYSPEFNQFVGGGGGRFQDEYGYHGNAIENTNGRPPSPAIVDLRINPRRISEWNECTADLHERKVLKVEFNHQEASIIDYESYNQDIDTSQQMIQYGSPRLLKKILQAPAGVDLKQLISYEDSYDITPISHDIHDNDSDTLTAESNSCINDLHVESNYQNNYSLGGNNTQNVFQGYDNNHIHHPMEHYGLNENSSNNVIVNCQKWLANSSSSMLNNNDNNHSTDIVDNAMYYKQNQIHNSYEMQKSYDDPLYYDTDNNAEQCDYSHNQHFEEMEHVDDGNIEAVDIQQHGCGANQWSPTAYAYLQQNRQTFYDSHNLVSNNTGAMQYEQVDIKMGEFHNVQDQRYSQYVEDDYEERGRENFNGVAKTSIQEASPSEPLDQMYETNFPSHELESSTAGNIMDCYWPQWPSSYGSRVQKSKIDYKLENLLNLGIVTSCQVEQLKSDQTSCVYCYTAPIVTQRIFPSSSSSTSSPASVQQNHIDSNIHQGSSLTTHRFLYNNNNNNNDDDDDTLNCTSSSSATTLASTDLLSLQSQRLWTCSVVENATIPNPYTLMCDNTIHTNSDPPIHGNPWMSDYV